MALPKISKVWPYLLAAGAALLLLAISIGGIVWFVGRNDRANAEISEYEKEIAELNAALVAKQSEISQSVIREYHTKTIERERIINQNASTISASVPDKGKLSAGWVYAHNKVAAGEIIDSELASNSEPSNTSATDALEIINVNYDIARANADKLTALQDWVRQQEKASEEATVTE